MQDTVWVVVLVMHHLREGVFEFITEIGDHFVSHYVMIVMIKYGAAHVVAVMVHKVYKTKGKANDETKD